MFSMLESSVHLVANYRMGVKIPVASTLVLTQIWKNLNYLGQNISKCYI
jgi:hypothetical protein